MAVRLRLKRHGRRNRPYYRIVAMEARRRRDGKELEVIGHYDPIAKKDNTSLKLDRAQYWLSVGAQPTETVADILKKHGVQLAGKRK